MSTVTEIAPPEGKPYVSLMDIMLAYTEFDRPFAAPPAMPKREVANSQREFRAHAQGSGVRAEGKEQLDWDGTAFLNGEQLQKKIDVTVTQPPDVIKRIVLEES